MSSKNAHFTRSQQTISDPSHDRVSFQQKWDDFVSGLPNSDTNSLLEYLKQEKQSINLEEILLQAIELHRASRGRQVSFIPQQNLLSVNQNAGYQSGQNPTLPSTHQNEGLTHLNIKSLNIMDKYSAQQKQEQTSQNHSRNQSPTLMRRTQELRSNEATVSSRIKERGTRVKFVENRASQQNIETFGGEKGGLPTVKGKITKKSILNPRQVSQPTKSTNSKRKLFQKTSLSANGKQLNKEKGQFTQINLAKNDKIVNQFISNNRADTFKFATEATEESLERVTIDSIHIQNHILYVWCSMQGIHFLTKIELHLETSQPDMSSIQVYRAPKTQILDPLVLFKGMYIYDRRYNVFYKIDDSSKKLLFVDPKEGSTSSLLQGRGIHHNMAGNQVREILISQEFYYTSSFNTSSSSLSSHITSKTNLGLGQSPMIAMLKIYDLQDYILEVYSLSTQNIKLQECVPLKLSSRPNCVSITWNSSLLMIGTDRNLVIYKIQPGNELINRPFKLRKVRTSYLLKDKKVESLSFSLDSSKLVVKWSVQNLNHSASYQITSSKRQYYWSLFTLSLRGKIQPLGSVNKESSDFSIGISGSGEIVNIVRTIISPSNYENKSQEFIYGNQSLEQIEVIGSLSLIKVSLSGQLRLIFSTRVSPQLTSLDISGNTVAMVEPKNSRAKRLTHLRVYRRNVDCGSLVTGRLPDFGLDFQEAALRFNNSKVYMSRSGYTFCKIINSTQAIVCDVNSLRQNKTSRQQGQLSVVTTLSSKNGIFEMVSISDDGAYVVLEEKELSRQVSFIHILQQDMKNERKKLVIQAKSGFKILRLNHHHTIACFYCVSSSALYFYQRKVNEGQTSYKPVQKISLKNVIQELGASTPKVCFLGDRGETLGIQEGSLCRIVKFRKGNDQFLDPFSSQNMDREGIEAYQWASLKKRKHELINISAGSCKKLSQLIVNSKMKGVSYLSIWERDLNLLQYNEIQMFRGVNLLKITIASDSCSFTGYDNISASIIVFKKNEGIDMFYEYSRVTTGLQEIHCFKPHPTLKKILFTGKGPLGPKIQQFLPDEYFFGDCAFLRKRVSHIFRIETSGKGVRSIVVDTSLLEQLINSFDRSELYPIYSIRLISILVQTQQYNLLRKALSSLGFSNRLYIKKTDPIRLALKNKDRVALDIFADFLSKNDKKSTLLLSKSMIIQSLSCFSQPFKNLIISKLVSSSRMTYPIPSYLPLKNCSNSGTSNNRNYARSGIFENKISYFGRFGGYSLDKKFGDWLEKKNRSLKITSYGSGCHDLEADFEKVKYLTLNFTDEFSLFSRFGCEILGIVSKSNQETIGSNLRFIIMEMENRWISKFSTILEGISHLVLCSLIYFKFTLCGNKEECANSLSIFSDFCGNYRFLQNCFDILNEDFLPRILASNLSLIIVCLLIPQILYEFFIFLRRGPFNFINNIDHRLTSIVYLGALPVLYFSREVKNSLRGDASIQQLALFFYFLIVGFWGIFNLKKFNEPLRIMINRFNAVTSDIISYSVLYFLLIGVFSVLQYLVSEQNINLNFEENYLLNLQIISGYSTVLGNGSINDQDIPLKIQYLEIFRIFCFSILMFNMAVSLVIDSIRGSDMRQDWLEVKETASRLYDYSLILSVFSSFSSNKKTSSISQSSNRIKSKKSRKYLHMVVTDNLNFSRNRRTEGGLSKNYSGNFLFNFQNRIQKGLG